jgi:hypothetical protein
LQDAIALHNTRILGDTRAGPNTRTKVTSI